MSILVWGVNNRINELSNVPVPVMLMPDDFKAYSKIKVDNHLFNQENQPLQVQGGLPYVFPKPQGEVWD